MNLSVIAKSRNLLLLPFFVLTVLTVSSCKKESVEKLKPPLSSNITSFELLKADSSEFIPGDVSITIGNDTVKITVPGTTVLDGLVPVIKINALNISPLSGVKQNFNNPVSYTITSTDNSKKTYVVKISLDKLQNLVYIGSDDNNFYALDSRNGNLAWRHTANQGFNYSNPILNNHIIYAGCVDANMYAFDASFGTVKWKFPTINSILSAPALDNGVLYFGSDDNIIYAVDAVTGTLKWKHQTGGIVDSSPAVANGVVYIASADGYLYALDASTGNLNWRYHTISISVQASPVVSNNIVYIGDRSGHISAIDAVSGTLKWQYSTNGISLEQSRPVISNGVIYFASWYSYDNFNNAGSVYAISEANGSLIWKSLNGIGFTSGPTIADGNVFISGDDGNIYALKGADGSIIWKNLILPNGGMPTIKGGAVYIAGGGSRFIYSLDETTGDIKWKSPLANGLMNSKPIVIDANGN